MSTLLHADPDHIRRFTHRMRSDEGAGWRLVRSLLKDYGLDPQRVIATSSALDGPQPPQVVTLVADGSRVFSFFRTAHPKMATDGLPVVLDDGSFDMQPGPALIELPTMNPWNTQIDLAFRLLEEEAHTED